jgi:hypothetical protein
MTLAIRRNLETTRNLAPYVVSPPTLRRSDATLELPRFAPPAPPRHAVPTVYRPERVRPDGYRGVRRAPTPVWSYLLTAVGAVLLVEAVATLVALAVIR